MNGTVKKLRADETKEFPDSFIVMIPDTKVGNAIRKILRRLFPSKEMREYRKMHRRHRKELVKLAKETYEWDWNWLHEMVLMQIRHMHEYYSADNNVWQADESRFKIIEDLQEILDIQKEIVRNYEDDCGVEIIYDNDGQVVEMRQPDDYAERLTNNFDEEAYLYKKFYSLIGDNIHSWWD